MKNKSRKTVFSMILAFLFCFSCSQKSKTPDDLIPKDKMIDVLTDVSLAEAATFSNNVSKPLYEEMVATKYADILQKYHVSYGQFSDTFNYYVDRPDSMAGLMQEVENRLSMMNSKVEAHSRQNRHADTLKNSKQEP